MRVCVFAVAIALAVVASAQTVLPERTAVYTEDLQRLVVDSVALGEDAARLYRNGDTLYIQEARVERIVPLPRDTFDTQAPVYTFAFEDGTRYTGPVAGATGRYIDLPTGGSRNVRDVREVQVERMASFREGRLRRAQPTYLTRSPYGPARNEAYWMTTILLNDLEVGLGSGLAFRFASVYFPVLGPSAVELNHRQHFRGGWSSMVSAGIASAVFLQEFGDRERASYSTYLSPSVAYGFNGGYVRLGTTIIGGTTSDLGYPTGLIQASTQLRLNPTKSNYFQLAVIHPYGKTSYFENDFFGGTSVERYAYQGRSLSVGFIQSRARHNLLLGVTVQQFREVTIPRPNFGWTMFFNAEERVKRRSAKSHRRLVTLMRGIQYRAERDRRARLRRERRGR